MDHIIWLILVLNKVQEGRKVKQLNLSLFDNYKFLRMFHMNKHKLYDIIQHIQLLLELINQFNIRFISLFYFLLFMCFSKHAGILYKTFYCIRITPSWHDCRRGLLQSLRQPFNFKQGQIFFQAGMGEILFKDVKFSKDFKILNSLVIFTK